MLKIATIVTCVSWIGSSAAAVEPKKENYLHNFLTCDDWLRAKTSAPVISSSIARWAVEKLRSEGLFGLGHLTDADLIEEMAKYCRDRRGSSMAIAVFSTLLTLPKSRN